MKKKPHQFHLTTFIQIIVAKLKYTWKGVTNYCFYCQIVKQIHIDCSYKRFPIVTFTVGQVSLIGHIKLKTAWGFDAKCLSLVPDDASEMKSNWDNALALTNLEHAATSHLSCIKPSLSFKWQSAKPPSNSDETHAKSGSLLGLCSWQNSLVFRCINCSQWSFFIYLLKGGHFLQLLPTVLSWNNEVQFSVVPSWWDRRKL